MKYVSCMYVCACMYAFVTFYINLYISFIVKISSANLQRMFMAMKNCLKTQFYCVNTSYPMDNMLNRSAQTGPPNVRKRRPVFPPAGRSSHCTRQVACRTSFLSRQADVIVSFSFGACTACTDFLSWKTFIYFVSWGLCFASKL